MLCCYCNIRYNILASFSSVFIIIIIIKVTFYCEWVLTFKKLQSQKSLLFKEQQKFVDDLSLNQ